MSSFCKYCDKEYSTSSGRGLHEIQCLLNPDRKSPQLGRKAWNKGLTKENSKIINQSSEKLKRTIKKVGPSGCCSSSYLGSEDHIKNARKGGGFRKGAGRGKKEYVENILNEKFLLRSSYEIILANWLNDQNILWVQPKSFFYELNGKKMRYFPDFFLPDYSIIIETKNDYLLSLQTEKMDAIKKVSNYPLHILTNDDIANIDNRMKSIIAG